MKMRNRIAGLALALALLPGVAGAVTIGIGAFGGSSTPLVQDDNGSGSLFGIRVPVGVIPMVTVEPYWAKTSGGDKTQDLGGGFSVTRDGIDVTSYGANVLLMFGGPIQMYPFAGIGSNQLKRNGLDETKTGYDFGLGLGFKVPLAGLSVHVRGAMNMVQDPGSTDTSRKWGEVTAGVSYGIFHFPPLVP